VEPCGRLRRGFSDGEGQESRQTLAKQDNPRKTKAVLATGRKWYSISPEGFEYWERAADIVNKIPADQDGAFLLSLLKPLGIEQGKPFNPDAHQKQILTEASRVGWAMDQTISMAPRSDDAIIYPGKHWEWVLLLNPSLRDQFWRDLELRANYYFEATLAAPAMKDKVVGVGSQYFRSARTIRATGWMAAKTIACAFPTIHQRRNSGQLLFTTTKRARWSRPTPTSRPSHRRTSSLPTAMAPSTFTSGRLHQRARRATGSKRSRAGDGGSGSVSMLRLSRSSTRAGSCRTSNW
jgi:hypothetical protein